MKYKRITAGLLWLAILFSAFAQCAFADEEEETEEPQAAIYSCLTYSAEALLENESLFKYSAPADEEEEKEPYVRSYKSKSARSGIGVPEAEPLEPGSHIVDGRIVYIKEDGTRAKNEVINGRQYGITGFYTSGDIQFDAMLAWIFRTAEIDKYEFGSEQQLHELFRWEVNNMGYRKSEMIDPGTHGWELARGKALLLEGKGNCYMFAGLFYELSRAIGYEPVAYSGTISTEKRPHGWVEIEFDGTPYIFDTEICYQQIYFEKNYSANFYMQTSEQLWGWYYIKAEEDMPETIEQG